jgi:hypothetical protein
MKQGRPRLCNYFDAACLTCTEKFSDSSIITPNSLIVLVSCIVNNFILFSMIKVDSMSKGFVSTTL